MSTKRPVVLDLFCGAGGLSHGFELAGFDIGAALDFDPIACATYHAQNPHIPLFNEDVRKVSAATLIKAAKGKIDIVIGGPSCQGFSTHGKRDPNDPRNFLFKQFVRLVSEIKPSWVVMENVKGLLTYDKGYYRDQIHAHFNKVGYRVESRILKAVEYGVPQFRERLIFIATRTNKEITFPSPTHCDPEDSLVTGLKPYVTVEEAISDLPTIGPVGEAFEYASNPKSEFQNYVRKNAPKHLSLQRAKPVSVFAMKIIKHVPQGGGVRSLPLSILPPRFKRMRRISTGALRRDCTTLYYRLSLNRPAYTITCNFSNVSSGPFVHPAENRALTPREAARIQSFPDNYRFVDKQVQKQIGNAVPPLLGRAVAKEIYNKIVVSPALISRTPQDLVAV